MADKSLREALRSGGSFVKAKDLVGEVITVVSYEATEYEFSGKMNASVEIQALNSNDEEITVSGTGNMLQNLQAAVASGYELPLELKIVEFKTRNGKGYGLDDPSEESA